MSKKKFHLTLNLSNSEFFKPKGIESLQRAIDRIEVEDEVILRFCFIKPNGSKVWQKAVSLFCLEEGKTIDLHPRKLAKPYSQHIKNLAFKLPLSSSSGDNFFDEYVKEFSAMIEAILEPVFSQIIELRVEGSNLNELESAIINELAIAFDKHQVHIKQAIFSMPEVECDTMLKSFSSMVMKNVKHLKVEKINQEGYNNYNSAEVLFAMLRDCITDAPSLFPKSPHLGKYLKTIEIRVIQGEDDYPSTFVLYTEDLPMIRAALRKIDAKLSIKNARFVINAMGKEGDCVAEFPTLKHYINEVAKTLKCLVDSDLYISLPETDFVWGLAACNKFAYNIVWQTLDEINSSQDNSITLQGNFMGDNNHIPYLDLLSPLENILYGISRYIDKAIASGNNILPQTDELLSNLRDLKIISERAEVRNYEEMVNEIENFLTDNFWLINGIQGIRETLFFSDIEMPQDILYNIASFLPNKLPVVEEQRDELKEEEIFTSEQMDAIWEIISVGSPRVFHYGNAIDLVEANDTDPFKELANTVNSYIEKHSFLIPILFPLRVEDENWGERWALYFQYGHRLDGTVNSYIIDPLMDFGDIYYEGLGQLDDDFALQDCALKILQLGVEVTPRNSGAWVLYIMEKLQCELSSTWLLSPGLINEGWMQNRVIVPILSNYPDINEMTSRYEMVYTNALRANQQQVGSTLKQLMDIVYDKEMVREIEQAPTGHQAPIGEGTEAELRAEDEEQATELMDLGDGGEYYRQNGIEVNNTESQDTNEHLNFNSFSGNFWYGSYS